MTYLTIKPEQPFAEELHRHQEGEVRAELKAERIEAMTQDLLKDAFNPYIPGLFAEAIGELVPAQAKEIADAMRLATSLDLASYGANRNVVILIKEAVEAYWYKQAKAAATSEVKNER